MRIGESEMSALILSVGDKPVSAKTFELGLEQHSYRTTLAQTAKEAVGYADMPRRPT
jgi:CheY-like chemotaxis protein